MQNLTFLTGCGFSHRYHQRLRPRPTGGLPFSRLLVLSLTRVTPTSKSWIRVCERTQSSSTFSFFLWKKIMVLSLHITLYYCNNESLIKTLVRCLCEFPKENTTAFARHCFEAYDTRALAKLVAPSPRRSCCRYEVDYAAMNSQIGIRYT